jgi:hypothetical protein
MKVELQKIVAETAELRAQKEADEQQCQIGRREYAENVERVRGSRKS